MFAYFSIRVIFLDFNFLVVLFIKIILCIFLLNVFQFVFSHLWKHPKWIHFFQFHISYGISPIVSSEYVDVLILFISILYFLFSSDLQDLFACVYILSSFYVLQYFYYLFLIVGSLQNFDYWILGFLKYLIYLIHHF